MLISLREASTVFSCTLVFTESASFVGSAGPLPLLEHGLLAFGADTSG